MILAFIIAALMVIAGFFCINMEYMTLAYVFLIPPVLFVLIFVVYAWIINPLGNLFKKKK